MVAKSNKNLIDLIGYFRAESRNPEMQWKNLSPGSNTETRKELNKSNGWASTTHATNQRTCMF